MTVTSPSDFTVIWSDRQYSKWQADGRSQWLILRCRELLLGVVLEQYCAQNLVSEGSKTLIGSHLLGWNKDGYFVALSFLKRTSQKWLLLPSHCALLSTTSAGNSRKGAKYFSRIQDLLWIYVIAASLLPILKNLCDFAIMLNSFYMERAEFLFTLWM